MILRMIIMLVAATALLGGIFGFKMFEAKMTKQYMASMGAPAQAVSTGKAEMHEWRKTFSAVGSLRAVKGVDIAPEIAGIVQDIKFDSGAEVKQGDLLVQLSTSTDTAALDALKADAALARVTHERNLKQFKVQAVSRDAVDRSKGALDSANAKVAEQQAYVDKKSLRAPFDGKTGIRRVDLGQYLQPGMPVVTLQALDTLYLDFLLPQQALSQIKVAQKVTLTSDAWPARSFEGAIAAIDPKVDPATRNATLRATVANADRALLPGMYAAVEIDAGQPENVLTLPQTAIVHNPYGSIVYLIELKDGKPFAKQVFVTTGETRGDQIQVLSGVKEGEEVVTSGQLKIRNGAPLVINNDVMPSNDAAPTPSEK